MNSIDISLLHRLCNKIYQMQIKEVVNKVSCNLMLSQPRCPPTLLILILLTRLWPVLPHIFLLRYGEQCDKDLGLCSRPRCRQRSETGPTDGPGEVRSRRLNATCSTFRSRGLCFSGRGVKLCLTFDRKHNKREHRSDAEAHGAAHPRLFA